MGTQWEGRRGHSYKSDKGDCRIFEGVKICDLVSLRLFELKFITATIIMIPFRVLSQKKNVDRNIFTERTASSQS